MKLLDVTLREGEQRPGVEYSVDQKVAAAGRLAALGVDYVQVGFPVAGERTGRVCDRLDVDAATTGICRAIPRDVEAAVEAGVDVVDLFAPTSETQLDAVLGESRASMHDAVAAAADAAADHGLELHLTAMDGFRTDAGDLDAFFGVADAEWYSVADTVGGLTPAGVTEKLDALDTDLGDVGVHFHDDLGVATANALAAADAGAGKADVSVAGIGERAGNTPLEEFVAAAALGDEAVETGVDESDLLPAADAVLDSLGETVSASKPLLGSEAFAHESGLHTAAMLDDPSTFEPFDPGQFGGERRLLFGAATGRGAARRLLERADRAPSDENVAALRDALADREAELTLPEAVELAADV